MRRYFTKNQVLAAAKRQGNKCAMCGICFSVTPPQGDHIIPFAKGGQTTLKNCQALCAPCNSTKGSWTGSLDLPTDEELQKCPYVQRWRLRGFQTSSSRDVIACQKVFACQWERADVLHAPRWLWKTECARQAMELVPDDVGEVQLPESVGFGFHVFEDPVVMQYNNFKEAYAVFAFFIGQDMRETVYYVPIPPFPDWATEVQKRAKINEVLIGKWPDKLLEYTFKDLTPSHLAVGLTSYLQMTVDIGGTKISAPAPTSRKEKEGERDFNATAVTEITWRQVERTSSDGGDKCQGKLTCMHAVVGHFYNHWNPRLGKHVRTYRRAHVKGPKGAPFRTGQRVNVVRR